MLKKRGDENDTPSLTKRSFLDPLTPLFPAKATFCYDFPILKMNPFADLYIALWIMFLTVLEQGWTKVCLRGCQGHFVSVSQQGEKCWI